MQILDGKLVSTLIKNDIKNEVEHLNKNNKRIPTLATILVGDDGASLI